MPRPLAPGTSLAHLRKEAKRWLKALRAADPEARARLARVLPIAPARPGLRDVQHALALEHGVPGWTALKARLAELQGSGSPEDQALRALLVAAERGEAAAVRDILEAHPSIVDRRGTLDGHTGLRTALHFGVHHEAVVRALLERGADPNVRDEGDNAYPIHFAAERGDLAVIRLLVEHGARTVAGDVDDHQLDIIGWATCFPGVDVRLEVVEYLLAHGARHTLFSAVAVGDVESIRARVAENPADLERPLDRVIRRRRALHLAVLKNQLGSLRALVELGADPNAADASGLTPLDEAALRGAAGMTEVLLAAGAHLTLPAAIALGRGGDIERLLQADPRALQLGHRWGTLIVKAAVDASAGVIDTLVRYGADVNAVETPDSAVDGTRGYSALHAAAFHGNLEAVEALLKHGAHPRSRDSRYGGTPVGWANFAGRQEVFQRLLEADIDLFDAIDFDRPDRIPEILRRDPAALHRPFGAYLPPGTLPAPWCPDPDITPLVWASSDGKVKAARILAARGGELTAGGHLARTHEQRVGAFLRMACVEGVTQGSERQRQTHAADRLLRRHPDIARDSIYTAVVCGEVEEVRRLLAERPQLARAPGGPRQWPPLLYLCTARLPGHPAAADAAVEIARMLLDAGADPNASYAGGDDTIRYTALASVIGRGEEQAPMHPHARALAALLLHRGAEPYDKQVLYNGFAGHASFRALAEDDLVWLLELIYQASLARGRHADWADPDWGMLEMGGYGDGAGYLLHRALDGNYLSIAEWALSHGASPNPGRAPDPRMPATLYEQAMAAGLTDFAELLARYGAPRSEPPAGGVSRANDIARLFRAADHDQVEVAERLLDTGLSPNVENKRRERPLHHAAYAGSARVAKLLVARGAEIDPRDESFGTTPIYWALYGQRWPLVDLLTPLTRDVWALVPAGKLQRLREVLAEDARLATSAWEGGTPLFALPDDEMVAAEIVRLFLAHGADPSSSRKDGATAEQIARARGLDAAADLLKAGIVHTPEES